MGTVGILRDVKLHIRIGKLLYMYSALKLISKGTCPIYIVYWLYHKVYAFLLRLLHLALGI